MFKITDYKRDKHNLKAELLNNVKEVELLQFLAETVPGYKGQLNKRFETYLSKSLAEKYGTYEYKYYNEPNTEMFGQPSEYDKTINNVNCYLSKETYSKTYYKLTLNYKGTEYRYSWDNNNVMTWGFANTNKSMQIYSWESIDELIGQIQGKIKYTNVQIEKIKDNIKHINKYTKQYNKLVEQIDQYNEQISYVIADNFKIK